MKKVTTTLSIFAFFFSHLQAPGQEISGVASNPKITAFATDEVSETDQPNTTSSESDSPKVEFPFETKLHGTKIPWAPSLKEAIRFGSDSGKLVFLIQVSGNFAREEFT